MRRRGGADPNRVWGGSRGLEGAMGRDTVLGAVRAARRWTRDMTPELATRLGRVCSLLAVWQCGCGDWCGHVWLWAGGVQRDVRVAHSGHTHSHSAQGHIDAARSRGHTCHKSRFRSTVVRTTYRDITHVARTARHCVSGPRWQRQSRCVLRLRRGPGAQRSHPPGPHGAHPSPDAPHSAAHASRAYERWHHTRHTGLRKRTPATQPIRSPPYHTCPPTRIALSLCRSPPQRAVAGQSKANTYARAHTHTTHHRRRCRHDPPRPSVAPLCRTL